jgi:putative FmdB family regulatory protein
MPMFEFKCNNCNSQFETLVFGNEDVVCDNCGSKNIEKQLSIFSSKIKSTTDCQMQGICPNGSCCSNGMCNL